MPGEPEMRCILRPKAGVTASLSLFEVSQDQTGYRLSLKQKSDAFYFNHVAVSNEDAYASISDLVSAAANFGQSAAILVVGITGSGKTYTMVGTLPTTDTVLDDRSGLVPRVLRWASAAGHLVSISYSEYSTHQTKRTLAAGVGLSYAQAVAAVRSGEESRAKAVRSDSNSGTSSRSWIELVLSFPSGGRLSFYDIPGRESSKADDVKSINDGALFNGLQDIAKNPANPTAWKLHKLPKVSAVKSILTLIGNGTPTATFGCVDLSQRIATLSIATLLRFMTNTLPVPTVSTEPILTALPSQGPELETASPFSAASSGTNAPLNSLVTSPQRSGNNARYRSLVIEHENLQAAIYQLRGDRAILEDIVLTLRNEARHNVPKVAAMLSAFIQSCSSETGRTFLYAAIVGLDNRFPGTLDAVLDEFLPRASGVDDDSATIHEL